MYTCAHLERGKRGASKNCKNLFSFTVCTRCTHVSPLKYSVACISRRTIANVHVPESAYFWHLIYPCTYIRAHVTVILRLLQEYMSDSDQYRMCILVFNFFSCLPSQSKNGSIIVPGCTPCDDQLNAEDPLWSSKSAAALPNPCNTYCK